jgi:glycosyltransferase involved in cell wall biosynthesis
MVRTLQVSVDCPWPALSGGDIRNLSIANAASTLGPVHMVCFGTVAHRQTETGISIASLSGFDGSNPWHGRDAIIRTTINVKDEDIRFLRSEIDHFNPDVAIIEGSHVARTLAVFRAAGVPTVLDMHNIESDLFRSIRRNTSISKYIKDILYGHRRWKPSRDFDRDISLCATETWVTSPIDRARLVELGGSAAVVIPNPIPDEGFADFSIQRDRYTAPHAIFVGNLSYPPNVTAAIELARNIWPKVLQEQPGASITICGRMPSDPIKRLSGLPGIQISPDPAEVGSLYRQAGYTMMPVRQGSGTRIKVVEAMAAGTVVIATRKAVEGLSLVAGKHYLPAESTKDFVHHFVRGLEMPEEMAILAEQARGFALEKFGEDTLARSICERLAILARASMARNDAMGEATR